MPGSTVPVATQPAMPCATDQPANGAAPSTANTVGSGGSVQLTASFDVQAAGSPLATHSPRYPFAEAADQAGCRLAYPPPSPAARFEVERSGRGSRGRRLRPALSDRDESRAGGDGEDDGQSGRGGRAPRSEQAVPAPGRGGHVSCQPRRRSRRPRSIGFPLGACHRGARPLQATPISYTRLPAPRFTAWTSRRPDELGRAEPLRSARSFERRRRPTGSSARSGRARCRAGGSRSGPSGSAGRSAP